MINRITANTILTKKFANQLFHSIVYESFINALPINKSDMTTEEDRNLRKFTFGITDAIGGIDALESAIDIDNKSLSQNVFIGQIYDICTESAKKAAKKNVDKYLSDNKNAKTQKFEDLLDESKLDKEDYTEFAKKIDHMNIDEVSDIIKEKTKATIKSEQESYKKEKEIDQELKDALDIEEENTEEPFNDNKTDIEESNPSTDIGDPNKNSSDGKTLESYLNLFLEPTAPRHHVSLFSRLQETAMECMSVINLKNEDDYMPIVYETTVEAFFPKIDHKSLLIKDSMSIKANESYNPANEEICSVPDNSKPKIATLVSIIVYTIMETLKTMGIYCPNRSDISDFIMKNSSSTNVISRDSNISMKESEAIVKECKMKDLSKLNSSDLSDHLIKLKNVVSANESYFGKNMADTQRINVVSDAVSQINNIKNILTQRNADMKANESATEPYFIQRKKIEDSSQCDKIYTLYGKNPIIDEIQFKITPGMESVIDVLGINKGGSTVKKSFINIEYACESKKYLDYIVDRIKSSKLNGCDKHLAIIVNDGNSSKISIK